jgi:hypothetical protein
VAQLFDDDLPPSRATHIFNLALAALIMLSVSGVVLESVDAVNARFTAELVGREERWSWLFTAGFWTLGSIRFRKVGRVPVAKACDLCAGVMWGIPSWAAA